MNGSYVLRARYGAHIDGAEQPGLDGAWFETVDPSSRSTLAEVARCNAKDVDAAVASAAAAFRRWRVMPGLERARILAAIAARLLAERERVAHAETLDNGKPLTQARAEVDLAARYFEFYAGLADKIRGESMKLGPRVLSYTHPEPFGVTAHIVPWNGPLTQAARGVAPALAAGNTAVVKPAEDTPLSCLELARIASEAGLPPGVLNVVPGFGVEAGEPLAAHPGVGKVVFTGSVATGMAVAASAAATVTPLTLELGGKSPNVVFADADLDRAARGAVLAINYNAGQVCSAGSRLLVERRAHDDLVERIVQLERQVVVGPGIDDPAMGPITTEAQWEKVRRYVEIGREEGAVVAVGGDLPEDPDLARGRFVLPTVFVGVDNDMRIAQEEIFGPVLSVIPFDGADEAIEIANASPYGLVAGVWTRDVNRAHAVADQLEAGQVFVNSWFAGGVETPFGGTKHSGYGREKGAEALSHYTQTKTVTMVLGD